MGWLLAAGGVSVAVEAGEEEVASPPARLEFGSAELCRINELA